MITKGYYETLKALHGTQTTAKNISGTEVTLCKNFSANMMSTVLFNELGKLHSSTSNSNYGVVFGDNGENSTGEEYYIKGNRLNDNFAETHTLTQRLNDNGNIDITVVFTLTNNTTDSITIKEIGYVGLAGKSESGSNIISDFHRILFDRTVLSNPLTIEGSGGVGQLTYTITVKFPSIEG